MARSRVRRYAERRERHRLVVSLLGITAIILFFAIFGLRLLVGFSLLVDRLRGSSPAQPSQSILLPPVLNPHPSATNSATIPLTGSGTAGTSLIVYVNEAETKKLTISDDGTFSLPSLNLVDGTNTVSARITDEKGNASDLSNVLSILYKKTPPTLDVATPVDGTATSGEPKRVTVSGKTDEETAVTVNGRLVFVRPDGSFAYDYPLSDGNTVLTVVATDKAGNQTIVERRVSYQN